MGRGLNWGWSWRLGRSFDWVPFWVWVWSCDVGLRLKTELGRGLWIGLGPELRLDLGLKVAM